MDTTATIRHKPTILYFSEIPTPYRHPLLLELARDPRWTLHVAYCAREQRDRSWGSVENHPQVHWLDGYQLMLQRGKYTLYFNRGIHNFLKRIDPDVIVVSGYAQPVMWQAVRFAKKYKLPYFIMTESHHRKMRSRVVQHLKAPILRRFYQASHANLVTGSMAARYIRQYGAPQDRTYFFPNTIDAKEFSAQVERAKSTREEIRRRFSFSNDRVLVLTTCALLAHKGVDELIEAMEGLEASLLFVGSGPLASHLSQKAQRLGISVGFAGHVHPKELPMYYAAADIFVLASLDEPWGVVVMEALASSLPVIVTDAVGAGADLVHEGKNGFVVPAGDTQALQSALKGLIESAPLRSRFGSESRRIIAGWDYEFARTQFGKAIEDLMRAGPVTSRWVSP